MKKQTFDTPVLLVYQKTIGDISVLRNTWFDNLVHVKYNIVNKYPVMLYNPIHTEND